MTTKEMNKRLEGLTQAQIEKAEELIRMGYGGSGLLFETDLARKQVNAMFQKVFEK